MVPWYTQSQPSEDLKTTTDVARGNFGTPSARHSRDAEVSGRNGFRRFMADGAERLGLGGWAGGLAGRTVEDDGGLEHGPVAEADEPRALQPDRARAVRLVAVDRDRQPAEPNGLLGGRGGDCAVGAEGPGGGGRAAEGCPAGCGLLRAVGGDVPEVVHLPHRLTDPPRPRQRQAAASSVGGVGWGGGRGVRTGPGTRLELMGMWPAEPCPAG